MILKASDNQEIVIGAGKEQMFSIDTSTSIIFDILRDKMYSNKIGSVSREVASNSRDANRESGTDKNIQIEFTDNSTFLSGDVSIIFRDFGVGISPDRMENVFLKYAASTKRGDNIQTGGFGMGAKTPFSYTDSFIIHTVNDNMDYVYSAIIDKTGNGKIILLSEEPTESESGTEIIIPVLSTQDRLRFEEEVYRATSYWDGVDYINFTTPKKEFQYVVNEKDFRIIPFNGWSHVVGLVDGIPYEIKPKNRTVLNGYTVMFNLDLEEITINANRESLQYDDKTQAHIDAKYDIFVSGISKLVREYLEDNSSYAEAFTKQKAIKINTGVSNFENLIYSMKQNSVFGLDYDAYFNGEPVTNIKFRFHSVDLVTFDNKSKYQPTTFKFDYPIVYHDKGRVSVAKNESLGKFLYIKPIKGNPDAEIAEEFAKLQEITAGDFQNYSEVKVSITRASTAYQKKDYITLKFRGYQNSHKSVEMKFDKVSKKLNTDSNVIFLPVYGLNAYKSYSHNQMKIVKHVYGVKNAFYVNKTVYEKHLEPAGYKTLDSLFKEVDLSQFSQYLGISDAKSALSNFPKFIVNNFPELLPESYQILVDRAIDIPKELENVSWHSFNIKKDKFDYYGVYEKFRKSLDLNYPMLMPYLRSSSGEARQIRVVKDYITKIK